MKVTVVVAIISLLSLPSLGQVLFNLRHLSGPGNDYISAYAVDSQGNTYISYYLGWSTGQVEQYNILDSMFNAYANNAGNFIKLDKNGQIVWRINFSGTIQSIDFDDHDNPYVAVADSYSIKIAKLDKNGNELWKVIEGTSGGFYGLDLIVDGEGNAYVTGTVSSWNVFGLTIAEQSCCGAHDFLVKVNSAGQIKWAIASSPNAYTNGVALDFDPNGNLILGGQFQYSTTLGGWTLTDGNSYVASIDSSNGAVLWAKAMHAQLQDLKVDLDGTIYITGSLIGGAIFNGQGYQSKGRSDFYLAKLQSDGNLTWIRHEGTVGDDYGSKIEIVDDILYVTGMFSGNVGLDGAQLGYIIGPTGFISRFQKSDGKASWIKGYGTYSDDGGWNNPYYFHSSGERHLKIAGSFYGTISAHNKTLQSSARDLFVAEIIDTVFASPGVYVTGKIFSSANGDCNPNQQGLKKIIVKAEPGPVYGITNGAGDYRLKVQPGSYTISQILPQKKRGLEMIQTCPAGNQQVTVNDFNDVPAPINFGNTLLAQPYLEADVVAGRFRRCFENDVVVQYCNDGYAAASNVVLTVEFPEYVIPLSSNIPWTEKHGQQLIFKFPTVAAGFCQRIIIRDSVICGDESIRGLTQCVTASITPLNAVTTDPEWDGSQLVMAAKCLENGFVKLSLANIGLGAMADSADFRIYADDALAYEHRYLLTSKDSLVLQLPANGKTIRMEAYTTPHSPQASVNVTIEGCGSTAGTVISKGFVNAFFQDDADAELETFCATILDSFDPNDKQVVPAGITSEHRINGTDELEYVIRFQNTGTDVAYDVVIRDDLDESLDLSTLQVGVSSHPVSFEVAGTGKAQLVWRFANIMLPDSTTNEPASHGFVKFKIKPQENLAKGTIIRNNASIFFDFNSAVTTNEVFNTIGLPDAVPTNALTIQNCSKDIMVHAGADQEIVLCDEASVKTNITSSEGYRYLTVQAGAPTFQISGNELFIEQLSEGVNVLKFFVTHCNNLDSSTIRVKRVVTSKPLLSTASSTWCSADLQNAKVSASGKNLSWYTDAEFTKKIFEGTNYVPTGSNSLYIVDHVEGCVSEPALHTVTVHPTPAPPETFPAQGCAGVATSLTAQGTNLIWYSDSDDRRPAYAGQTYRAIFASGGEHMVYVSQSTEGCESVKAILPVSVKQYKKEESFIMNIITPNGDDRNEAFFITAENFQNCLGDFRGVTIYNRFGSTIFTSNKADFVWAGDNVPPGVYFYSVVFGMDKFHGTITVQK